jgi:hypothetical protein
VTKAGRMPVAVRDRIEGDLRSAQLATTNGMIDEAWALLENAHVLSQPWARPHVKVHAAMLVLGWHTRDRAEIAGQLPPLMVAGPGSLTGRYPEGNTGRADAPATRPMPVAHDLRALLEADRG